VFIDKRIVLRRWARRVWPLATPP